MPPSWTSLALSATAASVLTVVYAPQCSVSASYVQTFLVYFSVLAFGRGIWTLIVYPKLFHPLRHLPSPSKILTRTKGGNFLWGHFNDIRIEPKGAPQRRWADEVPNEGLIHYRSLFNESRLIPTTPKALAEVLVQNSYEFIKPSYVRKGIANILGVGILLAEGDEHRMQRKNLMPAFSFRHVKDLYPVFWSKSCELVQTIQATVRAETPGLTRDDEKAPVVEVSQWTSRATLDIIGLAGMGQDFGCLRNPDTEILSAYRRVFQPSGQTRLLNFMGLVLPIWLLRALPVQRNDDLRTSAATIRRTCRQIIQQKKTNIEEQGKNSGIDIISVALESKAFSEENLVDQMMTFLAAGHETTASTMVWAILALCRKPEYQVRLREEVRARMPSPDDPGSSVTSETLDKLPFLHAVCNEVLRVHTPVSLSLRETAHDTSIIGQFVPAGTTIVLAASAINVSKSLWGEDAAEFNPDRWTGPGRANNGGAESNYSFMTFYHGPRSCIGQAFAKAEFACLLAGLVGRFEMELEDPEREISYQQGITLRIKGGLRVRMREVPGW
ncbi:MAG: hypothetical protein Q9195_000107 [Heterodermia aff. obscurata]